MSSLLMRRANRLAFPGGNPGVDPTHIAAGILRCSAVAVSGGGVIDLTTGHGGVWGAPAPTGSIDASIGPVDVFNGSTAASAGTFINKPLAADTTATIAAIVRINSLAAQNAIFATNQNNNSSGFAFLTAVTTGNLLLSWTSFGSASPALPLSVGVPYFVVVSIVSGRQNWLTLNLNTGVIQTATTTGAFTASASNGIYQVGAYRETSTHCNGNIAATMFSTQFLSMPQLLQWAQDPWLFWYPQKFDFAQMLGVSAGGATPSFSLAVTEAADIAAFTATFADQFALSVTENADTAAFTTSFSDQFALTATEAPDVAAFSASFADQFSLAATETPDTAAFTVVFGNTLALAATEAPDIAAFTISLSIQLTLATTETPDVAAFALTVPNPFTLGVSEIPDVAAFVLTYKSGAGIWTPAAPIIPGWMAAIEPLSRTFSPTVFSRASFGGHNIFSTGTGIGIWSAVSAPNSSWQAE